MILLSLTGGCFHERSFPMRSRDVVRLGPEGAGAPGAVLAADASMTPRHWLTAAHQKIRHLLPRQDRPVMLTDQMRDAAGRPVDVFRYFDRDVNKLQGLTSNWWALQHTAQSIEPGYAIEKAPRPWPGFQDVWIPVEPGVWNSGRLGFAQANGRVLKADCIVLLPGLWGDNGAKRADYLSSALRRSGYHVLSLEPRAHGQTEARYPDIYYTYGVMEVQDLMKVSEWLQDNFPQVRKTGLIGFCWGANQALLAAWFDGRRPDDPSISPPLTGVLEPVSSRRHYEAGIMAFSPVLDWEHFLDRMDTPKDVMKDPSPAMFQISTMEHMQRKGYPEITGSLRICIAYDFAYSGLTRHFPLLDGYRFLRLLPYRGLSSGDKMEKVRTPTIIVHSVNDPLQTAQEVVDLAAMTSNPQFMALMLPGGGHIGQQAYARKYFYSLIVNFFDPRYGVAAATSVGY